MTFEEWCGFKAGSFSSYHEAYLAGLEEGIATRPIQDQDHQARVEELMRKAGQEIPKAPVIPSEAVRTLRAKLIFEEAVRELIGEGLAVDIEIHIPSYGPVRVDNAADVHFSIASDRQPDLVKIADGAADTNVVVNGTFSACGIKAAPIQLAVDTANLAKFEPPQCPTCKGLMERLGNGCWCCNAKECRNVGFYPVASGPYMREDGKWIKPPYWEAPDIAGLLEAQGWDNPDKPVSTFAQSFSAQDWAKAFVETVKKNPGIAQDEATMLTWFANAIMRGYDEAVRTAEKNRLAEMNDRKKVKAEEEVRNAEKNRTAEKKIGGGNIMAYAKDAIMLESEFRTYASQVLEDMQAQYKVTGGKHYHYLRPVDVIGQGPRQAAVACRYLAHIGLAEVTNTSGEDSGICFYRPVLATGRLALMEKNDRKKVEEVRQPEFIIPVAHATVDYLFRHPGWWAMMDNPGFGGHVYRGPNVLPGTVIGFQDTMSGSIVQRGTITELIPPGKVGPDEGTDFKFRDWWRIVYTV